LSEQQRENEIDPGKPRDERGDEDEHLDSVDRPARRAVRVERALARAEEVRTDQVDLQEDAEDDRQREGKVRLPTGSTDRAEHP
jgi:hypothetical protein